MRLVTYNIHYGFGRDGINDLSRIAAAVDDADVVALQEVERYWPRSGMVDQVARLAKLLPDYWVAYGANIDLHSAAGFPGEADTGRRQFGNMILSRRPIRSSRNVALPRPAGEPLTMQRGALEAIIDMDSGPPVRFYSVHLDYKSPITRRAQLAALADHHERVARQGGPWSGDHAVDDGWAVGDEPLMPSSAIVLGDLNLAPGDDEYTTALQTMSGFHDAWDEADSSAAGATKDGRRIDHCWLTTDIAVQVCDAWVDRSASGSDHQPAWFVLSD